MRFSKGIEIKKIRHEQCQLSSLSPSLGDQGRTVPPRRQHSLTWQVVESVDGLSLCAPMWGNKRPGDSFSVLDSFERSTGSTSTEPSLTVHLLVQQAVQQSISMAAIRAWGCICNLGYHPAFSNYSRRDQERQGSVKCVRQSRRARRRIGPTPHAALFTSGRISAEHAL